MNPLKDYSISDKFIVTRARQPLYDMYIVTLIYSDDSKKEVKVFTDINAIDINNKSLAKGFIIDRLLGENGLMKKEGRDDYIFLGRLLENATGHYIPSRYYSVSGANKCAQQYFDEDIYPGLIKLFNSNPEKKIKENKSQRPRIYDEIKSPFDNEDTIQQLVELYANENVTSSISLYNQITKLDSKNENIEQKYLREFSKNIEFPNFTQLYNNMRLGKDSTIPDKPRIKNIFSKFRTYEEFEQYSNQNHAVAICRIYNNITYYKDRDKDISNKYINELRKFNLTDEELTFIITVGQIKIHMLNKFNGGCGVMGFHVNPQNLLSANIPPPNSEESEIKFYINAGYDTYRFARYFQEKCNQNNLNYYFKVVNPYAREYERSDKLCIFTELKDADIFLQLIKDIRIEHPDIKYRKPPLLAGTIQDFIGVGTDNISEIDSSYNEEMSQICFSTMENVFKGISKNDILHTIKRNPQLLQKIKSMIVSQATAVGLSSEKICIREDSIPKLMNAQLQRQIKEAQKEGKSLDEQIRNTKVQSIGE